MRPPTSWDHVRDLPLVGDAGFDALRDELLQILHAFLEIAVPASARHGAQRSHAAVDLVGAPLVEKRLAGALLGTRQEISQHDRVRARRERLHEIARVLDPAVRDDRNARGRGRRGAFENRGDLGHPDAGHDACRAGGAGAHPDLHRVGAGLDQCERALARGDVAADDLDLRIVAFDPAHTLGNALTVAMRRVNHERIDTSARQRLDALFGAIAHAHRGGHAQLALRVTCSVRKIGLLGDVFHRHQAAQFEGVVDDEHALELVAVHQRLALLQRGALVHEDEPLARRHDVAHGRVQARLETQVAVGHDAHHGLALQHREARHAVLARELDDLAHAVLGRHRDGVAQQARLIALDARDLGGLLLGGEVLVHHADATFLRQGDGQARFGDGVHRRRNQRQIEGDVASEPGGELGVAG